MFSLLAVLAYQFASKVRGVRPPHAHSMVSGASRINGAKRDFFINELLIFRFDRYYNIAIAMQKIKDFFAPLGRRCFSCEKPIKVWIRRSKTLASKFSRLYYNIERLQKFAFLKLLAQLVFLAKNSLMFECGAQKPLQASFLAGIITQVWFFVKTNRRK